MRANWHFKQTVPFMPQGKDIARKNFAQEERSPVGILIREALQNALDARADNNEGSVCVHMRTLLPGSFDSAYLDEIVSTELRKRLAAGSGVQLPSKQECTVFVIEDFGTKGLLGNVEDYNADGPEENWNAFWHREGEGAKGRAANGGAGQGKVTYFAHSLASMFLGLTVRASDNKRLLMGRASFLRDYKYEDGLKYIRTCYWTVSDQSPTPVSDNSEINRFLSAFSLNRATAGLSVVIPFSKPFDEQEAVASTVLDFYIPIVTGRLEVKINNVLINAATVDEEANARLTDNGVVKRRSAFTTGYRQFVRGLVTSPAPHISLAKDWNRDRTIPEEAFPANSLQSLRDKMLEGARLSFSLPITLKRKTGEELNSKFEVHIEVPPELQKNEESFVRQDLLIGGETHIAAGAFIQKTRSITWVKDKDLSDFLLAAENPSHLKWNASLAKEIGDYKAPEKVLQAIRQAVPRLLSTLLAGVEIRDTKSLARYFTRPSQEAKKGNGRGQVKPVGPINPKPIPKIESPPKIFLIQSYEDKVCISTKASDEFLKTRLPIKAVIEFAYDGLDQDPFKGYDPFDFDLRDTDQFTITYSGVEMASRQGNRIEFLTYHPNAFLEIAGFDPNMRLRTRLNYTLNNEADELVAEDADG